MKMIGQDKFKDHEIMFRNATLTRISYPKWTNENLNILNSISGIISNDESNLKIIKARLTELYDILKNQNIPDSELKRNPLYNLLEQYQAQQPIFYNCISYLKYCIDPLTRMMVDGSDIIKTYNNSEILSHIEKHFDGWKKQHEVETNRLNSTISALSEENRIFEKRILILETKLDMKNHITNNAPLPQMKDEPEEETPEHKVPYIPKLPQGEIKDRFEDRYKPQLEEADPKDLLKVAGRLKGAVNKSDLHPDDNFELNDMIKTFADGRLGKSEVYNDEKTKEITPFDN